MKRHLALTLSFMSTLLVQCANPALGAESTGEMGVSTLGWSVYHGDPQEEQDQKLVSKVMPGLLEKHQWAAIDKLAETLRAKKQYARGRTALTGFYDQIEPPSSATEEDWKNRLNDLNEWWKECPDSKTAPAALVNCWASYAWLARGTGYANTVSSESWKVFSERLAKGAEVFEKAKSKKNVCPMLYLYGLRIALGQSWERPEYDKLFAEATKRFPERTDYYFQKALHLQPRWHGGDKEWPEFAAQAANRVGGADGDKLYARIAWSVLGHGLYDNIFTSFPNLQWARIDKGLQALQKEYPDSISTQSIRVRFAMLANQNALAKQLMEKLGKNIDINTWQKKVFFFRTRKELLAK